MFDLDFLTNSMNYIPVSLENQVNVDAGIQDSYVVGSSGKDKGPTQEYILLPLQSHRTRIPVEDVAPAAHEKPSENADLPIDPNMPDLEDVSNAFPNDGIFSGAYDDDDVGTEADFNNMDNTIDVSPIPTLRVHKDHPKGQILRDPKSAVQTRGKIQKASSVQQALCILYGILEEGVCHQPPGFVDPAHPNKVYKVIKVFYGLHQAPRARYETLSSFLMENGFRRGTINKTLFIKKKKSDIMLVQVYVDDIIFGSTKKSMCTDFEDYMHKRFQMSSMGELTFFLGLQVKQQPDGILLVKTVCSWDSPFELEAYSDSDYRGASLDRKSTTRWAVPFSSVKKIDILALHGSRTIVVTDQAKEIKHLKAHIKKLKKKAKPMQKEYVSKQGRKPAKAGPTVHKDLTFDDLDNIVDDATDYMESEDAQRWRGGSRSEVPCSTKSCCNQKQTTNKNSTKKPNDDLSEACRREEACLMIEDKNFEEIQVLYKKVKRSDKDFIPIGSAEDERQIKEMNEESKDTKKKRVVNKTPREEDTAKVPLEQEVTEHGTKKRKSGHVKMIARKRPRPQPDDDSDDEHRKCLRIVVFDSTLDSEIMETKSFVSKLHKVSSPDGDYLVVYRVNGHFRAFNYLTDEDLKIMMESSTEENDQGWGQFIYIASERKYLSQELLQRMLDLGLEVEEESTTPLHLVRFIKQQLNEE
ncbi:putative ribonuclease H-like domain-containing protein [Tanacetum coccineum]